MGTLTNGRIKLKYRISNNFKTKNTSHSFFLEFQLQQIEIRIR
ncbi:hypothetical protein LEP1GSC111_1332 [Leptospira interrogans str. UT126]|nr:hypothetical protein LEP1GSC111_1332 [Leptospira interrogans str. UT126]EMN70110.1 hypothetical protein LEP1GSC100_0254 [Leptospira interrogans serovar Bataviae str. UI 08561]